MGTILDMLSRGVEQLVGRAHGPLNFRLVIMPTMVMLLGIRAGLADARAGQPAFLWSAITDPSDRARLLRSAVKDIGRVFVFAVVLDTIYQLYVLRMLYPLQVLIVAVAFAVLPYVLVRGPACRIARRLLHVPVPPPEPPAPPDAAPRTRERNEKRS